MVSVTNTSQINLKLPQKLISLAEEYVQNYGYTNVQELIRESLREKVFSEELNEKYVEKLLELEKDSKLLGKEKSEELLLSLGRSLKDFKND